MACMNGTYFGALGEHCLVEEEGEGFREAFETAIEDEVDGVGGGVILGAVVFGHGCLLVGFDTPKDVPVPGTATSWVRAEQPRALLQKRWCTSHRPLLPVAAGSRQLSERHAWNPTCILPNSW